MDGRDLFRLGKAGATDVLLSLDAEHPAVPTLVERLDAAETEWLELEELRDKHLRLAAEFDNYRKRTRREISSQQERAKAELAGRLLDVLDDLRRYALDEAGGEYIRMRICPAEIGDAAEAPTRPPLGWVLSRAAQREIDNDLAVPGPGKSGTVLQLDGHDPAADAIAVEVGELRQPFEFKVSAPAAAWRLCHAV